MRKGTPIFWSALIGLCLIWAFHGRTDYFCKSEPTREPTHIVETMVEHADESKLENITTPRKIPRSIPYGGGIVYHLRVVGYAPHSSYGYRKGLYESVPELVEEHGPYKGTVEQNSALNGLPNEIIHKLGRHASSEDICGKSNARTGIEKRTNGSFSMITHEQTNKPLACVL